MDEFNRQLNNKDVKYLDFCNFIFPERITIDCTNLGDKDLIFQNAEFIDYIDLDVYKPDDLDFDKLDIKNNINFDSAIFHKEMEFLWFYPTLNIDFKNATFNKRLLFDEASFYGNINFSNAKFNEGAIFDWTIFKKEVSFSNAVFRGRVKFNLAKFLDTANFNGAEFRDEVDLAPREIKGKFTLNGTKFKKEVILPSDLFEKIEQVEMVDTYFFDEEVFTEQLEEKYFRKEIKGIRKIKYKFFNIKIPEVLTEKIQPNFSEKTAFKHPIIHQKIKDDKFLLKFFENHPFWFFLWWLSANCGRSFKKWFIWFIVFSFSFGLLWYGLGENYFIFQPGKNVTFFTYIYYSVVTFTTLGFGDVIPTNWLSELLVSLEVFFGYIMLGGLITIFANKLARRS